LDERLLNAKHDQLPIAMTSFAKSIMKQFCAEFFLPRLFNSAPESAGNNISAERQL
jgi:hypothetical protein